MRRARKYLMLLVPVLWAGCTLADDDEGDIDAQAVDTTAAAPADAAAIEAEVGRIRDAWAEAARADDAARVAELYTADAVFVGADGQAHHSRQAIRDALTPGFAELANLGITSTDTEVGRDLVTDMGEFTQTLETPAGQTETVSGTYLVVLRRQPDGRLRIIQHLAAVPMEMPETTGDAARPAVDTARPAVDTAAADTAGAAADTTP